MEPANIDWKNIQSIFVQDDLYENINAPKFIDFSSPNESIDDDEAWFCKPECRHPKTAEDFLKPAFASKVKHSRSLSVFDNLRDGKGTSRRLNRAKTYIDQENENPNLTTPPEKRKAFREEGKSPKLKSSLSASNLFAGKEILSQITEFCSELKKMVLKAKESGDQKKKLLEEFSGKNSEESENVKPVVVVEAAAVELSGEKKPRKLRRNEKENNPIAVDLKKVAGKGQEQQRLVQVRTNPPSPQCFSGYREPLLRPKQTTPLKPSSKSIRAEKSVLQEQNNRVEKEELTPEKENNKNIAAVAGKEVRSMEMFWILKPCLTK